MSCLINVTSAWKLLLCETKRECGQWSVQKQSQNKGHWAFYLKTFHRSCKWLLQFQMTGGEFRFLYGTSVGGAHLKLAALESVNDQILYFDRVFLPCPPTNGAH